MSAPELVTVTIDERPVQVPKGTGLVETALEAGVEIPVFCYEPRLGPAVGACRMCLVEIEGMPKLQAGCTLAAQDGMVVRTAATSAKAAEGQNATLEFILVNHPLDCPVCDKGGECPLQDLTFRYGPGATRMTFPKRTVEKPIPISPTIALDRERCILCYRCTRFSEGVAEDGQLVAVNRGAMSLIATFEDEPYRAPFSGNVIELCPVGALTSTQYRFEARPWEIQNVPTVCTLCPVGCNVHATTREGKVKRILSRNHPEVDAGWLCDKGRFAYPHLYAEDRIREPLKRVRRRGFAPVTWDEAIDEAERLLRAADGRIVTALSGSESVELAWALGRLLRDGLGAHTAMLPEQTDPALDRFRLPLSAIADAQVVVVLGDEPLVERAPVVDLWVKAARRRGAEVVTVGAAGSVQAAPAATAQALRDHLAADEDFAGRLRDADRAVLIWAGSGGRGGAEVCSLATELGFADKPGCGALHVPATPNAARRRRRVGRRLRRGGRTARPDRPPDRLRRRGRSRPERPRARGARRGRHRADHVPGPRTSAGPTSSCPATSYLERDGTSVNLEGRLQRVRRAAVPPVPDELEWLSALASRFGVELPPYAAGVFEQASAALFGGLSFRDVGERAELRTHADPPAPSTADGEPAAPPRTTDGHFLRLVRYRPLFSGPAVERTPELQFQRPVAEVELAADDASRRGIRTGDEVLVRSNGTSTTLRARLNRRLRPGVVRIADEHAAELHDTVEVRKP